jgi:iron complex outermembrane recepter protein
MMKLCPLALALSAALPALAMAQATTPATATTAPASTAPASTAPASTAPASTAPASTAPASTAPIKQLGSVTITGTRPTSLPTQIPTTIEGVTAEQINTTINATDAEDALKYLPSLNVRKRYIGDFNHAVLASRASGTGNSARSLVYADGIPLSNLLGNGATYTPRWGLVTPQEIERVDVLYGPFSAAYSGNSVGAVVDYLTKMPTKFEAHAKVGFFSQHANPLGSDGQYRGNQVSASLGNKNGDWSWFVNFSQLKNSGQPLVFANKLVSSSSAPAAKTPVVTGAITGGNNPQNQPWVIVGTTTQYETEQQHLKAKLAYDFSPTVRASYTLGWWGNTATANGETYLRNAAGAPVYSGPVNINGRQYTLAATDISTNRSELSHVVHGLNVKSNTQGVFDWEAAASLYDYSKDTLRAPTVALPAALNGGAGRTTDMDGTRWNTLSLKGTWRPNAAHTTEFGYQREAYQLRTLTSDTADWINGSAGARFSAFNGNTTLQSLWVQDRWKFAKDWNATLGGRAEQWSAFGGQIGNAAGVKDLGTRKENHFSPKAALAYQASPLWALKASTGRAVRMPTAAELYQGSITGTSVVNNDPNLKPEKSWTTELTAERDLGNGSLRMTGFHEQTRDALYSQTNFTVSPTVTNIQNVDRIRTLGLELAYQANDVGIKGLDLSSSLTYADSIIKANSKNPLSEGKRQPRVPNWRANFLASYKPAENWTTSLGVRYSGQQYGQLDNSDTNSNTYTGVSKFTVLDVRVGYQITKQLKANLGIDNLNNAKYWAFHPYPQRTYHAELKFDL